MHGPGGRIAAYFLQKGLLAQEQITAALERQHREPSRPFADIVTELGFLTPAQIRAHFPQIALLNRLADPELSHFADSFVHERFAQGQVIFREGEIGNKAYVLLAGKVRIWKEGEAPTSHTLLADAVPGELFGEMALVDGGVRSATAQAVEPCEVMVLMRTDFLAQLKRDPAVALDVFGLLARRLRLADRLIANLADQADLDKKLALLKAETQQSDRK